MREDIPSPWFSAFRNWWYGLMLGLYLGALTGVELVSQTPAVSVAWSPILGILLFLAFLPDALWQIIRAFRRYRTAARRRMDATRPSA